MSKTFVISDLHGRLDVLEAALERIETYQSGGTVVFTGDYVDRGPASKQVMDRLIAGPQKPGWRWVCLKGNHEDMMIAAVRGEADFGWWIGNGGGATLASFEGEVSAFHLEWADRLPMYHKDAHRIYVHAGADPTKKMEEQTEAMLLWFRCGKHQNIDHPEGYIVHGHTPFDDGPIVLQGRCNLDTGAFFTGRLVVAVFDDETPGAPSSLLSVQVAA
jgi:serine/threonine protein phosphatase 1